MKTLLLAGAAVAALATVAQAADLGVARGPVAAAVVAPVFNWTGFYLGFHVGWSNVRTPYSVQYPTGTLAGAGTLNSNSALGGVHTGYNYQINNVVLGVEADLNYRGNNTRAVAVDFFGFDFIDLRARQNWGGSLRARAGIAIDKLLLFVTGGLAVAGTESTTYFRRVGVGESSSVGSSTRVGWTVGAGAEYAITPNVTARIEYRYADYGSYSVANPAFVFPAAGLASTSRFRYQSHDVRVGVSYLFSTGPSAVVARY
jgi:outer membrane immunogenic protein